MATYFQIQEYVRIVYGYVPKTCWITHCKKIFGMNVPPAPNRYDIDIRTNPCPEDKQKDIKDAFIYFGML